MSSIARDEASHAELSWQIAAWLEPQLHANERTRLTAARRAALTELYEAANTTTLPTRAALTLGYPSRALEHATLNQLRDTFAIA